MVAPKVPRGLADASTVTSEGGDAVHDSGILPSTNDSSIAQRSAVAVVVAVAVGDVPGEGELLAVVLSEGEALGMSGSLPPIA